ncbi:exopolysaccharide production protein ExoF [Methylobacterium sp. 190mf]|uniref:polysaccharide biosynthesis/export family protein n=1 Tax=Methylobacterium sp. 190mf TaxID=1761798 RepID=UPI00089F4AA5|nr:polysaccharide biosynthesis/export family protein [Methylobacterium sp. 190mf]SEF39053.1 exopolysaccharide production protein ExoF [Methylobacterium sp. 190mf]
MDHKSRLAIAFLVIASICSPALSQTDRGSIYRLGPQDKVEIRVNDIRTGSGDAHSWPSFEGEFSVNSEGKLSLPLVGDIEAGGKTTSEIATIVANNMKTEVGLTQLPKVAIQIAKYRPFYILGLVEKPGEYDFRVGLNVLQAVSIAGGISRQSSALVSGYQRDILNQEGETRALEAEKTNLGIKLARLEADTSGSETLILPDYIKTRSADPGVSEIIRTETATLASQRSTFKAQRQAILDEQETLKKEISTLSSKGATVERQLELSKNDLAQVSAMISRGLSISTRQLAAEQNVAAYQNNLLDVQLGIIRAKESLSKNSRDLIDLDAKHRDEVLRDSNEIRNKLAQINERLRTSATLIAHSSDLLRTAVIEAGGKFSLRYSLTSRDGPLSKTQDVEGADAMQPGDVLNVELVDQSNKSIAAGSRAAR